LRRIWPISSVPPACLSAAGGVRFAPKATDFCALLATQSQATFFTADGLHVPSRIDGSLSFGQYIRNIRMNLPAGAGSQLLSLSDPGLSFWMYRSIEPSGFAFRFCRGLIE